MNTDNNQTTTITVTTAQLGLIAYAAYVSANEMRKIARHYDGDEQGAQSATITANELDNLQKFAISAYEDSVRFPEK
jgi:hypothetical protein